MTYPVTRGWGCGWVTSLDPGLPEHVAGVGAAAGTREMRRGMEDVNGGDPGVGPKQTSAKRPLVSCPTERTCSLAS